MRIKIAGVGTPFVSPYRRHAIVNAELRSHRWVAPQSKVPGSRLDRADVAKLCSMRLDAEAFEAASVWQHPVFQRSEQRVVGFRG